MKSAIARSLIFLLLVGSGLVYAANVTIRKGETKTLKFNVSELTIMIYAGKLTDYPKINGSYPSRNKVYGTFDVTIGEYTGTYEVHVDENAGSKGLVIITQPGAISFSTADIVGGFAVKDGKLTRHSALSPGLETSEPKIKFGKDGEANTIRVGLSQNAPDSLVLDVYDAEEVRTKSGINIGLIVGLGVGIPLVLLLISSSVSGAAFFFMSRKSAQSLPNPEAPPVADKSGFAEVKTAQEVGELPGGTPVQDGAKSGIAVSKADEAGAKSQV